MTKMEQLPQQAAAAPQRLPCEARCAIILPMKTEQWLIDRLQEQAAAEKARPTPQRSDTKGVPSELFTGAVVRALEPADLLERQTSGADSIGAEPYKLKRLRYSHHTLARYLADGKLTQVEVSAQTGYSQQTITAYKRDPAFRELIEHYKKQVDQRSVDVIEKLETLAIDILIEISDRLEENPQEVSMAQLLECSKLLLDRSGYGPVTKQLNVNATISAETLMRIKENVEAEEIRRINLAETQRSLTNGRELQGSVVEGRLATSEAETQGKAGAGDTVREASGEVPVPRAAAV